MGVDVYTSMEVSIYIWEIKIFSVDNDRTGL